MQAKSEDELRAMTAEFRGRIDQGASLDELLPEAFAVCREAGRRVLGDAALRRAAHRRHGPAPRRHRRDEDRRGQDAGRDAARLPERARRQGRPRRHGQRLPGRAATPSGWVASTSSSACRSASSCTASSDAERQRELPLRHHVRHEQRVRLRLPARQHEGVDRALRPARAELRDRRRGRLDPDRRGAHAAHHLGLGRAVRRPLPEGRRHHPRAAQGHRLHRRREGALGHPDRRRHRTRRAAAERRQPLQPGQHRVAAPRDAGAARAHAVQARRQLPGRRRQGHHRRRVHRPEDAGAALVGRPAPGDRGQGRRRGSGREPDDGHDQLPELLPPLQEAGRHDRHRRHRGRGVPQDLQAVGHGHPDQQADGA